MKEIRVLPTTWRGTSFRSRTEARWAVFFDVIKVRWEYEPEGYELSSGDAYLPDFWLPEMELWAEVKPEQGPSPEELDKFELLCKGTNKSGLILAGAPWPHAYEHYTQVGRNAFAWIESCFSDEYTVSRVDGRPRLYTGCELDIDMERTHPATTSAMAAARSIDLSRPRDEIPTPKRAKKWLQR